MLIRRHPAHDCSIGTGPEVVDGGPDRDYVRGVTLDHSVADGKHAGLAEPAGIFRQAAPLAHRRPHAGLVAGDHGADGAWIADELVEDANVDAGIGARR